MNRAVTMQAFAQNQNEALLELKLCLIRAIDTNQDRLQKLETRLKNGVISFKVSEEEFSNVFGILGPRGAGKTTLLRRLYNDWHHDWHCPERQNVQANSLADLWFLPPLDCSIFPPNIVPGTGVLIKLLQIMKENSEEPTVRHTKGNLEDLRSLSGLYSRTSQAFQDLSLELSSSPEDFDHFITKGLEDRFKLGEKLGEWVEKTLKSLKTKAIVIILDDFDLVGDVQVRRWLLSLLDELHQPKIFFILSADFFRLEHLSWDPTEGFDDKTGRALINKLLPPENRIGIKEWDMDDRLNFPSVVAVRSETESRFEQTISKPETISLASLIENFARELLLPMDLVFQILPRWPRGLMNLYNSLQRQIDEDPKSLNKKARTPFEKLTWFLELLATSRGEPLLARKIKETPLLYWVNALQFSESNLSEEAWAELIHASCLRMHHKGRRFLPPLKPLVPVNSTQGSEPSEKNVHLIEVPPHYQAVGRNPDWKEPKFHFDLMLSALRDASDQDQPFWSELLLNLGIMNIATTSIPLSDFHLQATRNRLHLIKTWTPIRTRLNEAEMCISRSQKSIRSFFENRIFLPKKSGLMWMNWVSKNNPTSLKIGWPSLLDALRGARDPLLNDQLQGLLIDSTQIEGNAPSIANPDALALVPDQLWALILLTDGLARCPWRAFSGPLNWLVPTYLGLAGAFVRTAYVYALKNAGALKDDQLSETQLNLVDMLASQDPNFLLKLHEEDVLAQLAKLFSDDLDIRLSQEDSLSRAAKAYLNSEAYSAVKTLTYKINVELLKDPEYEKFLQPFE